MALTMPKLTLRAVKGAPLTAAEGDNNWTTIKNFCNSLAQLFGVALKADGNVNDNVLVESNFQNRVVSQRILQFTANFFAVDTGTTNSLAVSYTPAMTAYADGIGLRIRVKNGNTGAVTLNVDGLGAIPLRKNGATELSAGDLVGGQVIDVAYYGGAFNVLGTAAGSESGAGSQTNFTGLTRYNPDAVALPGNGNTATFVHGLGVQPSIVQRFLVCQTAELGFAQGDAVPLDQFSDNNGKPAFTVDINGTSITVTQNLSQPYVNRINAVVGTSTQITEANWLLQVTATKTFDESTLIFPALDLQVANPDGAISYGKDVFFISKGRHGGKSFLNHLDQTTRLVTRQDVKGAGNWTSSNMAPFRLADAVDIVIWNAAEGMYYIPLQPGTGTVQTWPNSEHANMQSHDGYKPCWVDESVNGAGNPPVIYAVSSGWGVQDTTTARCLKLDLTAHTSAAFGANLNLHDANITNVAEFQKWHTSAANLLLFQYNPIKKRIYVITDETGFIHIFTVNNSAFAGTGGFWDTAGPRDATVRAGELTYVKALPLCGGTGSWASVSFGKEHYTVEFDLTTGEEKAVTLTRQINTNGTGVVTRVPWVE